MMKATPGPWKIEHHQGNRYIVAEQGKRWDNPVICQLYEDVTPEDSVTIGDWLKEFENAEANAALIIAAPELLDALFWYAYPGETENKPDSETLRANARAAIAKATRS